MTEFFYYFSDILLTFALFIFLAMLGAAIKIISNFSQVSWYIDQLGKGDILVSTVIREWRGFKGEVSFLIASVSLFIVLTLPTLVSQISVVKTDLELLENRMQEIKLILNETPQITYDELSEEQKKALLTIVYD